MALLIPDTSLGGTTENRTCCEKQQAGGRRQWCNQDMGKKGFPMKKLQEAWAKRLNGKQWKLLVKDWSGVLPRRQGCSYDTAFEKLDQQMRIWEPPHFLLKKSRPKEKQNWDTKLKSFFRRHTHKGIHQDLWQHSQMLSHVKEQLLFSPLRTEMHISQTPYPQGQIGAWLTDITNTAGMR